MRDLPKFWKLTHVRLGEWDTSSTQDCDYSAGVNGRPLCSNPSIDIKVFEPIVHEHFNSDNLHNDIALIPLQETVIFTEFIHPICLPIAANLRSLDYYNKQMNVAGWGKTELQSDSKIKKVIEVRGVYLNQCRKKYRKRNIQPTQVKSTYI